MNNAEVLIKFKGDTKDADRATKEMTASIDGLTKSFTLASLAAKGITTAISVFKSGLDDAISRVDTLNNFPRVMSNLGISAEESAEVINDLSERLKGLPTTLNDAAMSVQRFTSKNGDVKQSEKLFLAVNNAILAGGANASVQSAALEQISQAYAKGKPDMMEWRSLMTAMPAQLKQVAVAMGYTDAAMLGEAVRAEEGAAEFQRMMDTMMRMNEEGVNGFKSFDEQARNATGGIGTSVKNMKTAFVRGIGTILTSVDEALVDFGGLAGVLQKIGKAGEKAFTAIGKVIKKVIPVIINIARWIKKNKEWIIPLTLAVATFVATFKTIKTVIAIINSVKMAIMALHAVMLANPIALIIAAVAALIAVFVYLWNNCEAFRNFWKGLWDGVVNVIKTAVDFIVGLFNSIVDFVKNNWQGLLLLIVNPFAGAFKLLYDNFGGFRNFVDGIMKGIKSIFSSVANFFVSAFENAKKGVEKVFNAIKKAAETIVGGIVAIIKAPINFLIDGLNEFIKALNKIKIPNWVPGVGGKGLHFDPIPRLNVGTNYVPQDTLAMIHEGEAVIPKKFNPYANGLSPSTLGGMQSSGMKPIINVYADFKTDPLGQTVSSIKTFSGGAKNDYNYGAGV